MTIQWGDTGRVAVGPLKTFNISVPTPYENLLGTPQSLGTSAPTGGAPGDISYTLQSSDFPTITPSPISVKYCAYLIISGQNLSGNSVTLNYNVLKNGTPIVSNQTHTSVANNIYWTHSHYRFYDVSIGDTLEAQTWASIAGVNLSYYAVFIYPTRLELTKASMVKDFSMTVGNTPALTRWTPNAAALGGSWSLYATNNTTNSQSVPSGTVTAPAICINSTMNGFSLGRIGNGDASLGTGPQTSTTSHPYYYKSCFPSLVSFREVLR